MMRYLKNVVSLKLDNDACIGCGMCTAVCPRAVFRLKDNKACIQDRDACIECGACALNCPADALSVQAGVGCAAAVISGTLSGSEACCGSDCLGSKKKKCC